MKKTIYSKDTKEDVSIIELIKKCLTMYLSKYAFQQCIVNQAHVNFVFVFICSTCICTVYICMYSQISLTGTSRGPHRKFQLLRVPVIESNGIK